MPVSSADAPKGETPAVTTDVNPAAAAPSPAEKTGDKPEGVKTDMLSAVKSALGKSKEKAPASEETDSTKSEIVKPEVAKKEGEQADAKSDDLTPEEVSQLKPKTKKRIDTLLADRAERDQKISVLEPKAQQFEKLVEWVREADLSNDEVNNLFDIGKNLKSGNLRAAYDKIAPVYESLRLALGEVLPDDVKQRVARGEISEADAKALVSARTTATVATQQQTRAAEQAEAQRKSAEGQAHVTAVKTTVTEWETTKAKADPDWKLKQPLVMQAIKLAISEQGYPKTTADAVKISDAALVEVNKTFAQLAPRKREVQPITDVASTRSSAKPKTMLEAARAGLAAASGAG